MDIRWIIERRLFENNTWSNWVVVANNIAINPDGNNYEYIDSNVTNGTYQYRIKETTTESEWVTSSNVVYESKILAMTLDKNMMIRLNGVITEGYSHTHLTQEGNYKTSEIDERKYVFIEEGL